MISDQITDNIVNSILRQMGATKIKTMPARINIVTFAFSDDFNIQYVYEMKENESIYLERVSPYPYFLGEPEDSDQLVEIIRTDLRKYRFAYESNNFPLFMSIAGKAHAAFNQLEKILLADDFANPNDLKRIDKALDQINEMLLQAEENTTSEPELG